MRNTALFFLFMVLFNACEKEIEIDLNSADPQIVIEGEITNQKGPYTVRITKTVNFSASNQYPAVTAAIVTLSDDLGFSEKLAETAPGVYTTANLQGQEGRTYTLKVESAGKTYIAQSKMPKRVELRGIKAEEIAFGFSTDTLYSATPLFDDPINSGNNYRFIQYRNGERDKSITVFNDNVNNGKTNERPILSQEFEIKRGDTLVIEMRCIDKPIYDYFFTLSQSAGQGPGGGTTPANPPNNITGNVLGYFSAHTIQRQTIIVR